MLSLGCFEWTSKQFGAVVEQRYVNANRKQLQERVANFFKGQLALHETSKVVDLASALDETAATVPMDRIATELPWLCREVSV